MQNGHHHPPAQPGPPMPQPSPIPTVYQWGTARDPAGTVWVTLTAHTPMGSTHLFLDGNAAVLVGESLTKLGQGAKSGLVIPQ